MKIVCDACGTRYSIKDGRVAGRSFKFRCKQCAHVIVMPGGRAPTADPAAAGAWHAVIDGIPRPVALEDLRGLVAAGVLGDRTLVWREGLDDWREFGSVDELRAARAVPVELAPEAAGIDSTAVDVPKARADAAGDAAPEDPPGPAPLRGVRHENSVLFSLGNLARLAAPAPAAASPGGRTEGSGLLDIQSLAHSLVPARGERAGAEAGELPVYGALPFSEPAVLIPTPPPRRDRRLVWALAATAGALAVMTVILLVVVLRGDAAAHAGTPADPPAVPGASPAPTAPGGGPAAPATPGTASRAELSAAEPTRTSAEATARPADRTEPTAAAPSADRTERSAPSAGRTEGAMPSVNRIERPAPSADRTAAAPSADRTERSAPSAGRTEGAVPSADRIERPAPSADRTSAAPSVNRTERSAPSAARAEGAAPSMDRTEHAATSPGQTERVGPSAPHAGSGPAHVAAATPAPRGSPADTATRRTSPRTASLAPPADNAEACSEVTCIVNGYADPCCTVHRRPAAASIPAAGALPESLDRGAIAGVITQMDTSGCGKQSSAHGDVKVSIRVAPSGAVTGTTVKSSPDPALDACVTTAVRKARFSATRYGGSFAYVWRF